MALIFFGWEILAQRSHECPLELASPAAPSDELFGFFWLASRKILQSLWMSGGREKAASTTATPGVWG